MTLHKEGHKIIVIGTIMLIIAILVFRYFMPTYAVWHIIIYAGFAAVWTWMVLFFRSPNRNIMPDSGVVLSPADGTIVLIEQVEKPAHFNQPVRQISVFMSPFNVHLNRFPVEGEVIHTNHYPGKYLVAWHPKSSLLNERTHVLIKADDGNHILVSQVAGFLARRIVCYAKSGEKVKQGNELGFIKFGSRVDIFIPLHYKVNAKIGDKVKGGLSILARL